MLDLNSHLPFRIAVLSNLIKQGSSDRFVQHSGMAAREWRVLAIIGLKQQSTPAEIAEATGLDRATVTRAVQRLLQIEFISKTCNPEDGRSHFLQLTAKGTEKFNEIIPQMEYSGSQFDEVLTQGEKALLLELIEKLQSRANHIIQQSDINPD